MNKLKVSPGRGVDPVGGITTSLKICRTGQSMFDPHPENVTFFHSKLLYNRKFHNIIYHLTDLAYADDAAILVWLAPSRQCPPINAFAAPLGLSYRGQNVGACDQSSTSLIDHGSYAVLPTIDRLQLGWLTRGVDPGVGRFWPHKICRKGQSMFDPLKILHSFIQNCTVVV